MHKTNNKSVGEIGENLACDFLIKKRYKVLFRNYRVRSDEIDIIARSFDSILVFIEVKTLSVENAANLIPEDHLTKDKLRKISRGCRLFAGFHKELINNNRGWRIDLIAIILDKDGEAIINHYENITA